MLCLAAGTLSAVLALESFTLAWSHSIEKLRWEEDWRIEGNMLVLTEARIRGTGAGMEMPAGAVLKGGVWYYRPTVAPQARLNLAQSGFAPGYEICTGGRCRQLTAAFDKAVESPTIELVPCAR